jgi:eight-cysteine-cluster-containing protein
MFVRSLLIVLLVGCGRGASSAPGDPPPVPALERRDGDGSVSDATPSSPSAPAATPRELYGSCEARVEQPEVPGECSSDTDCVRGGCSSEVCTSRQGAADVMTTCEILPCFDVLDACACVDGRCRWSLKPTIPTPALPPLLPR